MKYYVPQFKLSFDMPPQTKPEDKVGGLPWGLSAERYPICRDCGKSQSLLLQLIHHPERLDLERPGRNLFIFQCNHDPGGCATWDSDSGANACFILEPEELTGQMAPMPTDNPWLEIEARVVDWIEGDDGILAEQVLPNRTLGDYEYDKFNDLLLKSNRYYQGLRLGSIPFWVQIPEIPLPNWKFAGEMGEAYTLAEEPSPEGKTSPKDRVGHIHQLPDGKWGFTGPNLGTGNGYLFVRLQEKPEGCFFWQC
ncbi:MAG: hypothetical protein AAF622_00330 [Cyanobacteria bacterium P01_C01_bin.147]